MTLRRMGAALAAVLFVATLWQSTIANKKCYKVRLPASGGIQALPAYDSYSVTC